jgi:hypothetical protein
VTDFKATQPTWVVLDDLAQLLTVDTGQQFTTGHPCHIFTDEAEAVAYAISIGWEPEPDEAANV